MISLQEEANRPKSLYALTSLRFFAAVIIVIHHSKGNFGLDSQWLRDLQTAQPISFFFVLSGFILAYAYPSLGNIKDVRQFLIARIARIWPLHLATFFLVILLFPPSLRTPMGQDTPSLILANLFMVHSWIPIWNYYFSYNVLSWTISNEFAFYLIFPWLSRSWYRTWHIKLLSAFLMVVAVISCSNMLGLPSGKAMDTIGNVGYIGLIYTSPLVHLFEFTLGMALAKVFQRMAPFVRIGKTSGTIIEAVSLIMAVGIMAMSATIGESIFLLFPWIGEIGASWMFSAGLPCGFYGLLILVMAMEKGLISRLLSWSVLRGLGEMSFSIFLLHQILIRYYLWRIEDNTDLPYWFSYGYLWTILLLGSYVLMLLIERPCRQFILGLGQHKQAIRKTLSNVANNPSIGASLRNSFAKAQGSWRIRKPGIFFAGCLLSILIVAVPLYLHFSRCTITHKNAIDETLASQILDNWDPKYQRIQFGNEFMKKFILRGANIEQLPDRIRLQIIWENMNELLLKYIVAVHILDASGGIMFQADYPQNRSHIWVPDHVIWLEETEIPLQKLSGAKFIGIALYSTETPKILLPDRGDRDWNNHRLLIMLPEQL
jgi:peptidoglycan/LPS O-acetylase OafA/YrhL